MPRDENDPRLKDAVLSSFENASKPPHVSTHLVDGVQTPNVLTVLQTLHVLAVRSSPERKIPGTLRVAHKKASFGRDTVVGL